MVPASTAPPASPAEPDKAKKTSRYIRWSELLRRVFGIEILCKKCKAPLRLIALIKTARPPPGSPGVEGGEEQAGESWLN